MLGHCKAALKLLLIFLWIGFWYVLLFLTYKLKKYRLRDAVMRVSSAGILRIIGIEIQVTGEPSDIRPLLMVSNHISYLDVWIINSYADVHFTPKAEIDGWPLVGSISRMSGAVFVDRQAGRIGDGKERLTAALARGDAVCLFPEATTGTGLHTLPFKSSFLSLCEEPVDGKEVTVQPIAITYTRVRGVPNDTTLWPQIAWYGDMDLMPHLWNLLRLAPITAELAFLSPTTLAQHGDRKKLATHCHKVVDEAIQTIRGRNRHLHPKTKGFNPRHLRIKP